MIADELKEMSKKLSEANASKCETLAKLDEIHSNEVNKEVSKSGYICKSLVLQKKIGITNVAKVITQKMLYMHYTVNSFSVSPFRIFSTNSVTHFIKI